MAIKSVNVDRLFKKLPYFFDKPSNVLLEIAQNSQRAGATWLDIRIEDNTLTAVDNGSGAFNPEAFFTLAESDWNDTVALSQNPAGWGLYMLLVISSSLTCQSHFGTITVDCDLFLNDTAYREGILDGIITDQKAEGFLVRAELKEGIAKSLLCDYRSKLMFFPLDISVNGKHVQKGRIDSEAGSYDLETLYHGNRVLVKIGSQFPVTAEALADKIFAVWYGIPVRPDRYYTRVFLDVKENSPLDPVLPYRTALQVNEKMKDFFAFLRKEIVTYCTGVINGSSVNDERNLIDCMETMSLLATQEELDRLNQFFVTESEPHHGGQSSSAGRGNVVISKRNKPLVSEKVTGITVTYRDREGNETGYEGDCDDLVLPEGVITEVSANTNRPQWLKIKERRFRVRVISTNKLEYHNFVWLKAKEISLKGKKVESLSLVTGYGYSDGMFVYRKHPRAVHEFEDAVFDTHFYHDDGDTFDTQKETFEEDLRNDIAKVTGAYDRWDLLDGLRITGLDIAKIVNIAIKKGTMVVRMSEGKSKTVKIAA